MSIWRDGLGLKPIPFIAIAIVVLLSLIIGAAAIDANRKDKACAHAMALARTNSDSLQVVLRCEVPGAPKYVMPMYVPSGR